MRNVPFIFVAAPIWKRRGVGSLSVNFAINLYREQEQYDLKKCGKFFSHYQQRVNIPTTFSVQGRFTLSVDAAMTQVISLIKFLFSLNQGVTSRMGCNPKLTRYDKSVATDVPNQWLILSVNGPWESQNYSRKIRTSVHCSTAQDLRTHPLSSGQNLHCFFKFT